MILDESGLRNSLFVSTCLHIGMLLFVFFGLPQTFKPLPSQRRPIPVDIVEIGAITNTRVGKNEDNMPLASQTTKPAPPAPKAEEKPPEPVKQPEPPKPDPKPAAPEAEAEALLPSPKPQQKPKPPEPPKQEPQQDQLTSVLKNVAKLKPQAAAPPAPDAPKSDTNKIGATNVMDGGQSGFGPALSDRLTISAEDALRRQIQQCWNVPAGARNVETLVVEVLIEVNPDRTVRAAQVVDQGRASSDTFYRAAAEAALRALRNPRCNPLELPPDQYEQWKTIRFTFDPRDML